MQTQTYIMLTADEGKVLTNGTLYARVIALGNGDSPANYREITETEYQAILAAGGENDA